MPKNASLLQIASQRNFRAVLIVKFIQIISKLYDVHNENKQEIQAFER